MAQHDQPAHSGSTLSIMRVHPYAHRGIAVTSPALDAEGRIGEAWSAYGDNIPPALGWSAVIEAQSYVLIVEDPDAPQAEPFVHWLLWNIPGGATSLPRGLAPTARPEGMEGVVQGRNDAGGHGWYGPRPPEGHGVHRYHFQLFALSAALDFGPETQLAELVNALKGLTIASGELVGTYERPDPVADAVSPGCTGSYGADPHTATAEERKTGRGGLDGDDRDRHAPHTPDGEVRQP